MNDNCFALQSYPKCNYEQLRDFLVLQCKCKLQYITSSIDKDQVLRETFDKVQALQQKNVFLLLTAAYQLERVKEAAAAVERTGGRVIKSVTNNHKVNQQYCKLFERLGDCSATAKHPLDNERVWFLLFDTVHLLKCIRNNWISDKGQKISLDNETTASFADVKELYESEKGSILTTTILTQFAVNPSPLQLQNVQYVLKVFNDKVVAVLKLRGCPDTAKFIQIILNWWNVVNVERWNVVNVNYSRWIRNWLTGRTQRVVIHDETSDSALVTSGVPQGSVLGPLLFIIYINDLDVGIISKINKFADDTKLCHRAFTERDRATIQSDLNRLLQWAETWQMSFNIEKCSVMPVGANNQHFQHTMYDIPIETVQQRRDLGVIVTENLKHDKQVEKSVRNASRILGFIARNFEYKSKNNITAL
ncbi:Reverse transcriptase domain [Trinorchestia longiramus]|nr:Reverse transcriptase domain [Trinorchestia longiramus]